MGFVDEMRKLLEGDGTTEQGDRLNALTEGVSRNNE